MLTPGTHKEHPVSLEKRSYQSFCVLIKPPLIDFKPYNWHELLHSWIKFKQA